MYSLLCHILCRYAFDFEHLGTNNHVWCLAAYNDISRLNYTCVPDAYATEVWILPNPNNLGRMKESADCTRLVHMILLPTHFVLKIHGRLVSGVAIPKRAPTREQCLQLFFVFIGRVL
jgi:hypothetical protein